ncbi:MAG TPA: hypothetical protein VI864_02620 [Candidatus Bathyarchaeia archaeon]|nr:hypothetical protein [Candidatus Bathyarchaeia archaeon]
MSISIPQINVEIFRGPAFADDNFVKDWVIIEGGSFSTDGDIATVQSYGNDYGWVEKQINVNTNSYPKIQVRIAPDSQNWSLKVYDGTTWLVIWFNQTGTGRFESTLPAGKTLTKITIISEGLWKVAKFDYVFISKQTVLTPAVDLAEGVEITLPLLEMGVSGVKQSFPNNNAEYTGKISEFDRIIIYLYRQGETMKKVFGGIISDYSYRGQQAEYWLDVECLGLGQQLQNPTALVQKICSAVNGRTIIKEAIDAECPQLTDKFVDVDEDIASNHTLELDEVLPYEVVNEICRKAASIGGVIGFDAYVDSAGNSHVFARNKYTSSVSLTGKIEDYPYAVDCHRIKNKITVYGIFGGYIPTTGAWTDSLSYWTARNGVVSWVSPSYIYCDCDVSRICDFYRTTAPYEHISGMANSVPLSVGWIDFYFFHQTCTNPIMQIVIEAPDAANCFYKAYENYAMNVEIRRTLELGPDKGWLTLGSPDWRNIKHINFYAMSIAGTFYVYVRALKLYYSRFKGESSDSVSQAKYGTRFGEPQIDEELTSDAECQAKANSLIGFLKEPIVSFRGMRVQGDNAFVPGNKQLVQINNDAIDAYFRILEIRHVVDGVNWDTLLTLSNEPKMIDYIRASAASPKYAGATVIVPRDFSSIQEGINAVVIG